MPSKALSFCSSSFVFASSPYISSSIRPAVAHTSPATLCRLMVTTNVSVDTLMDKLGGAVVSRLMGMCNWHQINAPDYRVLI